MEDPDNLSSLPDEPERQPEPLTEEDIIGAVADMLTSHGYRFIPDSQLPDMKRALQPFLVPAA